MIFALSPRAEQALVALFKAHDVRRAYLAVVHGRIGEPRTIDSYLVRDRGDGLRGSTPRGAKDPDAKHAVTHIKPVGHVGDAYTLVECRLETGRTHQIRIHLSEAGHPVCGDKVYVHRLGAPPRPDPSGAPRLFLHATELGFKHPVTGQDLHWEMPLPTDLRKLLDKLRGARPTP